MAQARVHDRGRPAPSSRRRVHHITRKRSTAFATCASVGISTRSRAWTARARSGRGAPARAENFPAATSGRSASIPPRTPSIQKHKVTTPGLGYCHFPIAYQQEFFNQLTSEEVRTRFVRGHPVRYWFKPSGKRTKPSTAASTR